MEKVKLNELADIYLGVTHTPEYVFEGVPFLSVKDISGGNICFDDCKYISQEEYDSLSEGAKPKVGDMLFCRVGTLGKPIIIPEGTPLFGSFVSLGYLRNKDEDRCNLNYLRYWMYSNSFWKQVNSNVKGASQVNLNTGWLSKFDIDLPDINEQKYRISVLDKCKTIIEQREVELSKLDDLIKARFVELFGNILCDNHLPLVQLSELANIGSSKRIYANEYVNSGVPFYRSKEIRELGTGLKPSAELFIKKERYDEIKEKYGVPKVGDILIAAIGATIGYSWIVDTDNPFYYKDGNLIILSIKDNVNPIFLNHTMGILIEDFKNKGVAGSAQLALTIEKLEKMMVVNPDVELQNQFADFVKQVDKSKVVIQKALNEARLLFDSLMQEYFG